jgi:CRP/FNR family cyclic AMP-dependent transcriptional regulator
VATVKKNEGARIRFNKGEYLIREEEVSRDLFIIKFGRVKIFKNEGGAEVVLDIVGAGSVAGEVAAIDGGKRSASAVALETTEAVVIDAAKFAAVLNKVPDWFQKIARILVQRLREVDTKIHNVLDGDDLTHVAAVIALMTYSPLCGSSGNAVTLPYKETHDEIVDLLHLTLSDADAALADLDKKGLLSISRNKILIADRGRLETFGDAAFGSPAPAPVL